MQNYTMLSCLVRAHQWLPFSYRTKSSLLSVDPSMSPILTWNVLSMSLSFHHSLHTCSPHFLISKILHNILFLNLCHCLESRWNSSSSMKPPSISKQETTSHSSRPSLYYNHFLWSLLFFLFYNLFFLFWLFRCLYGLQLLKIKDPGCATLNLTIPYNVLCTVDAQ